MIPKTIHQTHYDENLDFVIQSKKSIEETNSSWDYKFWSNEMAQDLVVNSFPEFSDHWLSLHNSNIIKWNLFRFMVVHACGGLYVDSDTIFNKSIDKIIDLSVDFVGVKKHKMEIWIKDHFFLAPKNSKFLYHCIREIVHKNINHDPSGVSVKDVHSFCGGPFLYSKLNMYDKNNTFNYQLLNPIFVTNHKLKFEGYKNFQKENQRFNWNEVYVLHLLNDSWRRTKKKRK